MSTNSSVSLDCVPEYSEIGCTNTQEILVNARLTACTLPENDNAAGGDGGRAPLCVTAVVDRSGSMSGEKLNMVKQTLSFVTRQLKESDQLGLVVYDDTVSETFPLTTMDEKGRNMALDKINAVRTGGSTNLGGGLYRGLQQQLAAESGATTSSSSTSSGGIMSKMASLFSSSTPQPSAEPSAPPASAVGHSSAPPPPACGLDLQIGNLHMAAAAAGGDENEQHQWTMFVQGINSQDLTPYVDSVTYDLHPTFQPSQVTLNKPPFECARKGWGTFTVGVKVQLTSAYGGSVLNFTHELSFDQCMSAKVHHVDLTPNNNNTTNDTNTTTTKNNNTVHSVWLFTDGLVNAGDRSPQVITQKAQDLLSSASFPISVHTFGYGSSHNEELLRNIAEVGHGMYYFVEDAEQIGEAFVECLGGLLSVVAQKLEINLKSLPGSDVLKVYTNFKSTKTEGGWMVNIPDMFAEEHRDLLCQVRLNSLPVAVPSADIVECVVSYTNALSSTKDTVTAKCCVSRPQEQKPLDQQLVPDVVDQQRNRVKTMQAFEEARVAADSGNMTLAKEMMMACKAAVQVSGSGATDYCADLMDDIDEAYDQFESETVYKAKGKKKMMQTEGMWKKERAAGKKKACFTNKTQQAMKSAFSGA
eukprot:TRINITY_DN67113_c0_g1_i1.p1 TRINITY_DN67113_c0_g1~~TRINITY_DN67113_c0_g1_i1.p1  ORF type:complete len:642 (+),score=149.79 TRINITY_DN67113_c0_g1_i1:96-2021(+)